MGNEGHDGKASQSYIGYLQAQLIYIYYKFLSPFPRQSLVFNQFLVSIPEKCLKKFEKENRSFIYQFREIPEPETKILSSTSTEEIAEKALI